MMKKTANNSVWCHLRASVFAACLACVNTAAADIAVVVNPDSEIPALSERQVVDMFMGRFVAFPDGSAALPLDQPLNSELREMFYQHLTGKTVRQVNAYWAKLIFSGRATPPAMARASEDVSGMVKDNKNAISYIASDEVTDDVKVVLLLSAGVDVTQ